MRLLTHGLRSIGGLPFCGPDRRLLNRNGLFDYFVGDGLDVVGSSSVGGNSHVYGGISARPPDSSFWNEAGAGLSSALMAPQYDAVEKILGVRTVKTEELGSAGLAMRFGAESGLELESRATALSLAVNTAPDSHAARGRGGLLGCEDGSKTTTDAAFLAPLVEAGHLRVRELTEVRSLSLEGSRWRLRIRDLRNGAQNDITADKVVLAGGAFNTLALLLAARQDGTRLPEALGLGFGGNGDVAGLWLHDSPADLTASFPTLQRIRLSNTERALDIVEGAAPPPAFLPLSRLYARRLRQSSMIAGMGSDAMDGRVDISGGRLRLSYNPARSPIIAELQRAFDEIARRTGTRILKKKRLFTVHPSGGAAIGRVVDGKGEVLGTGGLFIADASVFPKPLGGAPSLTIAAWARHVASEI
jgi:cholesterol oxidase